MREGGFRAFPAEGVMEPIYEVAEIASVPPRLLDARLVMGWRHFGTRFFRSNLAIEDGRLCGILPLRIALADFVPGKSLRRVWRKNADLDVRVGPTQIRAEHAGLFEIHRHRFDKDVPDSLFDFLSVDPAVVPCLNLCFEVRLEGRLLAASFLDVGDESISSVYAMFDPAFSRRSLGIYTMLLEIEYGRTNAKRFYYSGYAYSVPSAYDYKKRFPATEAYDWGHSWVPLPRGYRWSRALADIEAK